MISGPVLQKCRSDTHRMDAPQYQQPGQFNSPVREHEDLLETVQAFD